MRVSPAVVLLIVCAMLGVAGALGLVWTARRSR